MLVYPFEDNDVVAHPVGSIMVWHIIFIQFGRMEVPKVMKPEWHLQFVLSHPSEMRLPGTRSNIEYPAGGYHFLAKLLLSQQVHDSSFYDDGPDSVVTLRPLLDELTANLHIIALDADFSRLEVDVRPIQAEYLPHAETTPRGQHQDRLAVRSFELSCRTWMYPSGARYWDLLMTRGHVDFFMSVSSIVSLSADERHERTSYP